MSVTLKKTSSTKRKSNGKSGGKSGGKSNGKSGKKNSKTMKTFIYKQIKNLMYKAQHDPALKQKIEYYLQRAILLGAGLTSNNINSFEVAWEGTNYNYLMGPRQ